jgi:rod shape-determining protein MreB
MASGSMFGRDMAIDLGTANTLVFLRGRGIVLDEPSVVAINERTRGVLAVGVEAKRMIGRTPGHIVATRPLRHGVITDIETTERMIRYFIERVGLRRRVAKPRLVVAVPSGLTGVERRAVKEACEHAGARSVFLLEEPLAAAIGAKLPIQEPMGSMIVDVGGGTTETGVVSLGGLVTMQATRVGGDELDAAIQTYVKREYSLAIGERTAEDLKIAIGAAFPMPDDGKAEIRGRDLVSGLPKIVIVTGDEIRAAIEEPVSHIVDTVKNTLDACPPELSADIMDYGITLTGGGALLRGLDERLRHETGMPVNLTDRPLQTVALGAGVCVEHFDELKHVLTTAPPR